MPSAYSITHAQPLGPGFPSDEPSAYAVTASAEGFPRGIAAGLAALLRAGGVSAMPRSLSRVSRVYGGGRWVVGSKESPFRPWTGQTLLTVGVVGGGGSERPSGPRVLM